MERATHIDKDGWYINGANIATVFHSGTGEIRIRGKDVDRLAAIEDILDDEYDLDRLSAMVNQRMTMREEVAERWKLTCNIPLDRLRELVQADKAGKCMVLPCKPGQLVWSVNSDRVSSHVIRRLERNKDGDFACSMLMFPFDDFGKKVFLTKAEAEAALRREQDG